MTAAAELSVVVPTYNRWETLARCLRALQEQETGGAPFEVVVVDDGSSDRTAELLAEASAQEPGRLRFLRQGNSGPAVARNAGIALARGPVVLMLDDDVLARPGLLREHLHWHRRHPDPRMALLGHVAWSDEVEVSPFMRFIDSNGMQFGYDQIRDGERVDFRYTYACNLSLKREMLLRHPFDTRFPIAAFEDIELGYRLEREGLEIHYNQRAAAAHYRTVTFEQFLRRMRRAGASLRLLHEIHPELRELLPPPRRLRLRRLGEFVGARLAQLLGLRSAEAAAPAHWRVAILDEMGRGYRGGSP
ncbi:MAG TPA: glycosyltransferase family 2 protein [Anaeromyxobacteraceae bacterium]|nr:glycosyltransferase family 2 protein [Anaeromyxobacteraceae bacterium]